MLLIGKYYFSNRNRVVDQYIVRRIRNMYIYRKMDRIIYNILYDKSKLTIGMKISNRITNYV